MKNMFHKIILVVFALVLNGIFLYFFDPSQFFAISQLHGQIGYNLIRHHSYNINSEVAEYCNELQQQHNRLIDYHEIAHLDFGQPQEVFPINDTIGYGVLLGLLWKLTGSLRFLDVQLLQIIIYSLLILLFYEFVLLLLGSTSIAFYCSIAHLLFFPLTWLNVQPVRDIWAYYGLLILAYGMVQFLLQDSKKSWFVVVLCGILFSFCQFIRPSVFLGLLTLSAASFFYAISIHQVKRVICMLSLVWLMNALFFWAPFFVYNLQSYNRWFVGPVGQDMLEGLGELKNPWGYHLCDRWVAKYIGEKYEVVYGTPEFDDAAKQEFNKAFYEQPLFYVKTIIKRIPYIILPALPWVYQESVPSWKIVLSKWYMRLFLLMGYIGLLFALTKRKYFFVIFVCAVLLAGLGKLPSHIEYRYLIPFYWAFSLAISAIFYSERMNEIS